MTGRQLIPNPFDSDVVIDPGSNPQTDVPLIHRVAFERCQRAYERVAANRESRSVLLYGQAGCGKTHLLGRFRKWLIGELPPAPKVAPALFVAIRMETGPGYIWRHVRRRFVEELTRPDRDRLTPLDAILKQFSLRHGGNLTAAFDAEPVRDLGFDLMRVLEHFAAALHRRLCRAWLLGDSIPESDLQLLNLPRHSLETLEEDVAEYDARRIVLAITRLCAPAPVVFCFDQIEALGLSQQTSSYGAFSRMGASLIDDAETGNSLVISTVLVTFLQDLQNGSRLPDFQRICKDQSDLLPLDWALGKELIDARLKLVRSEIGKENPLPEDELRAFYRRENQLVSPRRLIHEARRLFTLWQGMPAKDPVPVDDFLRVELEALWTGSEALTNPESSDAVLSQALPVALQLLGHKTQEKPGKMADLAIGSGPSATFVAYANHSNMTSLAAWLRNLQKQSIPAIRLVRDERLPISKNARIAQQRLDQIEQGGGRFIRPGAEALAALDAMRRLLARATSGDLSQDGVPVPAQTVREWLAANLPSQVVALSREIVGGELPREANQPTDARPDALAVLLDEHKVLPLEEAARLTELPREWIENYARTHPHRVGLFSGPCPVVCQPVAPAPQREDSALA